MIDLDKPLFLLTLLMIPAAYGLYFYYLFWRRKVMKALGDPLMVIKLVQGFSLRRHIIKLHLLTGSVLFLSFALAGPKIEITEQIKESSGTNVIFIIDVSSSMLARDISPNRLEKAKYIIYKSLDKLPKSQVALVIFSGVAYPLVPLTSDHGSFRNSLSVIEADMLPIPGSSLAAALNMANRFKFQKNQDNNYIFLFSDGEDHDSSIEPVLNSLEKNIKVFTIGVGTLQGSNIPIQIRKGKSSLKKDKDGIIVKTSLKEESMKVIAKRTGGNYRQIFNTQDGVEFITSSIKEAQYTSNSTKGTKSFEQLFQWFLGVTFLLLLL